MKRGFFPPKKEAQARLAEIMRPQRGDGCFSWLFGAMFIVPAIVGIGGPILCVYLFDARGMGVLIIPAMLFFVPGLYVLGFSILHRLARDESAGTSLARVPIGLERAADGELRMFVGRVVPSGQDSIIGPVSEEPCVWAEATYEVLSLQQRGPLVRTSETRESFMPFVVDDGHGKRVNVLPEGGLLRAAPHEVELHGDRITEAAGALGLLVEAGESIRARERSLRVGDRVVILGVVRMSAGYRDGQATTLASGPEDALVASGETREELIAAMRGSSGVRGILIGAGLLACGALLLYATLRW
jgi:hypothetical protein